MKKEPPTIRLATMEKMVHENPEATVFRLKCVKCLSEDFNLFIDKKTLVAGPFCKRCEQPKTSMSVQFHLTP